MPHSHSPHPSLGQTAVRPAWETLPAPLRRTIAQHLGASVVSVVGQSGGFTPGVAARLLLDDGAGAFVKAVPSGHALAAAYRNEARTAAALPPGAPAPRLLWTATEFGWVVLAFVDVDGRHPDLSPGSPDIDRVVGAVDAMGRTLTPCPVPDAEPSWSSRGGWLHGWRLLALGPPSDLGEWERRHLDELGKVETVWTGHADGDALVHGDIRSDNMLVSGGVVSVVDWAHGSRGAAWQDVADLVPHMVMAGHSPASAELHLNRSTAWRDTGAEVLTSYAAAYAGYWTRMSREPAPEGVPNLRPYQRRAAAAALAWLRHRLDAPVGQPV